MGMMTKAERFRLASANCYFLFLSPKCVSGKSCLKIVCQFSDVEEVHSPHRPLMCV